MLNYKLQALIGYYTTKKLLIISQTIKKLQYPKKTRRDDIKSPAN